MEIIQDTTFRYQAPHDIIWINDLSKYTDVPTLSSQATLLMPFVSDRGKDRVFAFLNGAQGLALAEQEFGGRNFRRHGQAYYQVLKTLEAGGSVIGMRLTPDDAKFANTCVAVALKIDPTGNSETKPMLHVKLVSSTNATLTGTDLLDNEMEGGIKDGTEGLVGYKVFPLFTVHSKGRGIYGNNFAFRLTPNETESEYSDYINYNLEVLISEKGSITKEEPYVVTFNPNSRTNNLSTYAQNVVSKYSPNVDIAVCEESVEQINEFLASFAATYETTPEKIELLVPPTQAPAYITYEETADTILTTPYGIKLASGSDGAWTGKFDFNSDTRTGMEEAFRDFYLGKINNEVFNVLKIAPSYILDANFPLSIKTAMLTLATNRIDTHCYLDAGILSKPQAFADYMAGITAKNWNASMYSQHCKVVDEVNDKELTVTTSYLLSYMLPQHYANWGSHKPMAGLNTGKITGVIEGTVMPRVVTLDEKDIIVKARGNYIEEAEGYSILGTQFTLYPTKSKLQHQQNARLLSEMSRLILKLVREYRFDFTEPDDITKFIRMGNDTLAPYKDKVTTIEYTVTQTEYEKTRGILNDQLNVLFKDIALFNKVTINVLGNGGGK